MAEQVAALIAAGYSGPVSFTAPPGARPADPASALARGIGTMSACLIRAAA